jgi:hypothetical protein
VSTSSAYVLEGEGLRCLRHGEVFAKTSACSGCVRDPGPSIDSRAETLPKPPAGCMSTEQLERLHVQQAKELIALRRKLCAPAKRKKVATGETTSGEPVLDLHAYNTATKLADAATKHLRAAGELARVREDAAIVARREREEAELARGAAH